MNDKWTNRQTNNQIDIQIDEQRARQKVILYLKRGFFTMARVKETNNKNIDIEREIKKTYSKKLRGIHRNHGTYI